MIYTIEQLKVVYKAGQKGLGFDEVIGVLDLMDAGQTPLQSAVATKRVYTRRVAAPANKKGKRVPLTEKILAEFTKAGKAGAHVKDIAAAIDSKPANVTAWLFATGKKFIKSKQLVKIAPATYAYTA